MTVNSLAPGYVVFNYTSNGRSHKQVLPVNPVAPAGPSTLLRDSSGASQAWTSFVADWVLLLKDCFNTGSSIDSAEMWTQASPTSVPILQDTTTIGVAGTSASADVQDEQTVLTFRTSNGSRMLVKLIEAIFPVDVVRSGPLYGGVTEWAAFASYLTGSSACVWSRGGAYATSSIKGVTKTNDSLRKKTINP